ncbi:MAG: hypothetical protein J6K72_08325 [Clostridia bacterium]|nr:hypothetical protein [Clostridia bacterium]
MDMLIAALIGAGALVLIVIVHFFWAENDKRRRKEEGLPPRKYGMMHDAKPTYNFTHKIGENTYVTTSYEDKSNE